MKNNLLEKLGVTPGPWELSIDYINAGESASGCPFIVTSTENFREPVLSASEWINVESKDLCLMSKAPEMLMALIECTIDMINRYGDYYQSHPNLNPGIKDWMDRNIEIIESATNKTWNEIKGLYNE